MLELKKIKKSYKTGDFIQHALKSVDMKFRKNEFVAILGPSGSGKTTLLNIIGGLDRYDSGDLIINNLSTKKFKDNDWDSYRNNCVGFIFQSYNLISHISVLENVILSTTLSGYKASLRKKKAMEALDKVGLKNHMHKRPNQLSGGQMQRVAIARALVNDPDIILADEPTGALDSKTSKQIMDLIKEIAKDKLVIMVTHNEDLAKKYASRIIELSDGEIMKDSNPINDKEKNDESINIKKTKMSYMSAINLSFKNLMTKKGRTFITSFASSIGIIGIALILSLSNGFKIKIDEFEKNALSQAPILIQEETIDTSSIGKEKKDNLEEYSDTKTVYALKLSDTPVSAHINKIDNNYLDYLSKLDPNLISGIQYGYKTNLNVLVKSDKTNLISFLGIATSLPKSDDVSQVITDNFDVIGGELNNDMHNIYLLLDSKNRVSEEVLKSLGYEDNVSFDDIIGKELKVVLNDDYYKELSGYFIPNTNYDELYGNENNITLKIAGILRGKEDSDFSNFSGTGILYNDSLMDYVVDKNKESSIVKAQESKNINVLTNQEMTDEEKETILSYLGANKIPTSINIFPKDFDSKEEIINYLDKYNKDLKEEDKILYLDQAKLITSLSGSIMDAITIVLIAFSSISLIVSSIMVGIITYTSVLERTKEIGILRAIGARKKDITRVFNAETLIIGLFSGILGIVITNLLIIPINNIIYKLSDLEGVAMLNPIHAIILILISVTLTLIGGFIPAKIASKKDPVIALRTE